MLLLLLEQEGRKCSKPKTPFHKTAYRPELDTKPLLDPPMISRYQHLVGILRWSCKLGRLDVLLEVSFFAFNAAPCEGHLDALYHISAT